METETVELETDPEVCACGEPSVVTSTTEGWCDDCMPAEVAADLAAERDYDAWRDAG